MALNPYMHPRNPYLHHPPDFSSLGKKYSDFGDLYETYKRSQSKAMAASPELVRMLTRVLLKEDFGLDVHLPQHRLVPTLPLRLNYLLWIQDLLGDKEQKIRGLDVGTGASCIYPLLGSRHFGFSMVGTESDKEAFDVALANVQKNGLQANITVVHTDAAKGVFDLEDNSQKFDFTMCNPPFHNSSDSDNQLIDDHEGAISDDVMEDVSDDVVQPPGKASETCTSGGEETFIADMIRESKRRASMATMFTSMVGKKCSLKPLKKLLMDPQIDAKDIKTTELCQGRTMRWAIAWTFESEFKFPLILTPMEKKRRDHKLHQPLSFELELKDDLQKISESLTAWMNDINVSVKLGRISTNEASMTLKTFETGWKNMRRKRREESRHQSKRAKLDDEPMDVDKKQGEETNKEVQLCAKVILKVDSEKMTEDGKSFVKAQMIYVQGVLGKDAMQQLIQYIKNKAKGIY